MSSKLFYTTQVSTSKKTDPLSFFFARKKKTAAFSHNGIGDAFPPPCFKQSIAEALKRYNEKISYRSDKQLSFGYTTYDKPEVPHSIEPVLMV
jgi:hypothetical protein